MIGVPIVTVLTRDIEPAVRLAPDEEAELLQALDEADLEEGISAEELFARLQRFCPGLSARSAPRLHGGPRTDRPPQVQ